MEKYRIVHNFIDSHTGERYTPNHESVVFSPERVRQIKAVEKVIGYKLIEEDLSSDETTENENQEGVVEETTVNESQEEVGEETTKSKKKNK